MVADCQELVGYVLARVKTTVEEKLGFHVESCVVSVSSTFHQTQRLALLAACKDEGFFNVRFLSDCLCAAIAFDVLFKKLLHPRNVLIFDFGSYKCESSVVTVGGKSYQVKSMSGLDSVGGVDVDNLIAKRFEQNFLQQNKKKKLRDSTKLKYFAERAKQNLSTSFNTKVGFMTFAVGLQVVMSSHHCRAMNLIKLSVPYLSLLCLSKKIVYKKRL